MDRTMTRRRRWDDDARGIGVADARAWQPIVAELADAAGTDGWVAEDPEAHLLPHLEAAAASGPLAITAARTVADGTFEVDLDWVGEGEPSRQAIRSALHVLVATIAETVTILHEPTVEPGRVLEVLTGSADVDGPFAGHGHTLRFSVTVPGTASSSP
jgi:hypothetical protein